MLSSHVLNRRAFLAACSLSAAAIVPWGGCSPAAEPTLAVNLVVGMELGYPPFESRDTDGRAIGVSVDLARALARHLGRELVIENMAFDGLIPALKTGKIDLVISSLTRTGERAQSIDFSDPYVRTGLCLLLARQSPVQGIGDLDRPGRKVAVKKGTTGHTWAVAHLKQATPLVLDSETTAVLEVTQGKADAFIYDQLSIHEHWKRNEATTRAVLAPFQQEAWAIGVRKGQPGLLADVNRFLGEFRRRGGFEELGDRWLKEPKAAFRQLGTPFVFD